MANNKFSGYNPKPSNNKDGNRLDRVNPYEFKKGMDYELMEIGCDRLAESTPEERMDTTETVLKNLNEHGAYYSALIHYETKFRNNESGKVSGPPFKSWLKKFHEDTAMVPLTEKDKLKEAIKTQIKKSILNEQDDEFTDFDLDDVAPEKGSDGMARKVGIKKGKGVKALDKEIEALKDEKESLKDKMFPLIQQYKAKKKGKKPYTKEDYESDLKNIKTSDKSSVATKEGGDNITKRIKAIIKRLEDIEKEKEDIILKEKMDKREVASTMMDRQTHKDLLDIIQECGIGMNEGASTIKPYYEIAKMAYMEGLTAGIRQY